MLIPTGKKSIKIIFIGKFNLQEELITLISDKILQKNIVNFRVLDFEKHTILN